MRQNFPIGTIINRLFGLLMLVLGVWVLADPGIFSRKYGLMATTSDARSVLRAVIGGTEIALALCYLKPKLFKLSEQALHRIGGTLFSAIVFGRLLHMVLEGSVSLGLLRESILEILVGLVFVVCIALDCKSDRHN